MFYQNDDSESIATIGGTFDTLHPGHKEYIQLAFEWVERVLIYVSSDEYCNGKKKYKVRPFELRVKELEEFIKTLGCEKRYEICRLNTHEQLMADYFDNPNLHERIHIAIVSPEYYDFFHAINCERKERGMRTFLILVKERKCNGENNKEYSSTKIRKHAYSKLISFEKEKERDQFDWL